MKCECGGELIKDKYTTTYICESCGQKYYFKKDFDATGRQKNDDE